MASRIAVGALLFVLAADSAAAQAPEIRVEPEHLVLGSGAQVRVLVPGPQGVRVRLAVNAGSIEPAEELAPFEAVYHPPATRYPQVALVLAWTEVPGKQPQPSVARVVLLGRTDLEIKTVPGAMVQVEVRGILFGPAQADRRGRVKVPVEVPPGVTTAVVLGENRQLKKRREVPLDAAPASAPTVAISPEPLPSSGGWALVGLVDEADLPRLSLQCSDAKDQPVATAPGVAIYSLAPTRTPGQISVTASIGEPAEVSASATATVLAPPAPPPPPPPPPRKPSASTWHARAQVSYSFAGGANSGPGLAVGAARLLPWLDERLFAEASFGPRYLHLLAATPVGSLDSSVWLVPLELSLRGRVLEAGPIGLWARLGGGVAYFSHRVTGTWGSVYQEAGLSGEALAGLEASYRIGDFEVCAELRAVLLPVRTPHLNASAGGLWVGLGAEYRL